MSKNTTTSSGTIVSNGWTISNGTGWITYTFGNGGGGGSITVDPPKQTINKDGCCCKKCQEKNEYAEPNQEDGSFICYSCRTIW